MGCSPMANSFRRGTVTDAMAGSSTSGRPSRVTARCCTKSSLQAEISWLEAVPSPLASSLPMSACLESTPPPMAMVRSMRSGARSICRCCRYSSAGCASAGSANPRNDSAIRRNGSALSARTSNQREVASMAGPLCALRRRFCSASGSPHPSPQGEKEEGLPVAQTVLVTEDDGLYPIAQAELGEDAVDVRFSGRFGHEELCPDLVVRHAGGHRLEDLTLARGEAFQRVGEQASFRE